MTSGSSAITTRHRRRRSTGRPPTGPVKLKVADYSVSFGGRFSLRGRPGAAQGHVGSSRGSADAGTTCARPEPTAWPPLPVEAACPPPTVLRAVAGDGRFRRPSRHGHRPHQARPLRERYVKLGRKLRVSGVVVPRGVRTVKVRVRGEGVMRTGAGPTVVSPSAGLRAETATSATGSGRERAASQPVTPAAAPVPVPCVRAKPPITVLASTATGSPGGTLTPTTRGVANKYLPCGTRSHFSTATAPWSSG